VLRSHIVNGDWISRPAFADYGGSDLTPTFTNHGLCHRNHPKAHPHLSLQSTKMSKTHAFGIFQSFLSSRFDERMNRTDKRLPIPCCTGLESRRGYFDELGEGNLSMLQGPCRRFDGRCLEGLDIRPSYRIMCSADIRGRHRRAAPRMEMHRHFEEIDQSWTL